MILFVCATKMEQEPLVQLLPTQKTVVCGVGLIDATLTLTRYLAQNLNGIRLVVHFGVAGAYFGKGASFLDICLASREVVGDAAICYDDAIVPFGDGEIAPFHSCELTGSHFTLLSRILDAQKIPYLPGTFVTVNGVTGSRKRGEMLAQRYGGLCENMEGAAIARVCQSFDLPMVEIRTVSNMVEDRNPANWQLPEAVNRCAEVIAAVVPELEEKLPVW